MISTGAITEYQSVFKKVYGTQISYEEAKQQAIDLLNFFKLIYKPITKQDKNEIDETNNR